MNFKPKDSRDFCFWISM